MMMPPHWSDRSLLAWMWLPVSWLYYAVVRLRCAWVRAATLSVPVLCVGNNTVGGTGKTPTVIALCQLLQRHGHTPHVISRGYKGHVTATLRVNPECHGVEEVGDEPLLIARHAPCWVSPKRRHAARAAIAEGASVIVMDDGLQNPSLSKTGAILVVDGTYGFGNRWMLPAGSCREPIGTSLKKASMVLVIGAPTHPSLVRLKRTRKPVFYATLTPDSALNLNGLRVHPFAGIGYPDKFFRTVEAMGGIITLSSRFPDHHHYTMRDLARLEQEAQEHHAHLVTTEKDAVRLPSEFRAKVIVVPVTLILPEQTQWEQAVLQMLKPDQPLSRKSAS